MWDYPIRSQIKTMHHYLRQPLVNRYANRFGFGRFGPVQNRGV
jgi:hypothetical protein